MSNLGDSNTPISGELFGLPSGWNLTENNDGEAVFEDTQGNVVLRRDATNNRWVTDEIDASSATLDNFNTADLTSASEGQLLQVTDSPPGLTVSSIAVGISNNVTDPGDPTPPVGDRGDLWYPLTELLGGTEQWSYETEAQVNCAPAVVGGTVYVGSYDTMHALSADDGTQQWKYNFEESLAGSPAVVDGTVYVGSGRNVYALSEQ